MCGIDPTGAAGSADPDAAIGGHDCGGKRLDGRAAAGNTIAKVESFAEQRMVKIAQPRVDFCS